MTGAPGASVSPAYDSIADLYDDHMKGARWVRAVLWRRYDRAFGQDHHVLDVGSGTGTDALHLAARGVRVTAVDGSARMMDRLRTKLHASPFEGLVDAHTGDVVDVLSRLSGPYDGIVSSFAALNTVDLASFAAEAARLLRPGRPLLAHLLSPAHRQPRAKRLLSMLRRSPEVSQVRVDIEGHAVMHQLGGPDELFRRFFAAAFVRRRDAWLGFTMALASGRRFYVLDLERRRDGPRVVRSP